MPGVCYGRPKFDLLRREFVFARFELNKRPVSLSVWKGYADIPDTSLDALSLKHRGRNDVSIASIGNGKDVFEIRVSLLVQGENLEKGRLFSMFGVVSHQKNSADTPSKPLWVWWGMNAFHSIGVFKPMFSERELENKIEL